MIPWHDLLTRTEKRVRAKAVRLRHRLGLPEPEPGRARLAPGFRHPIDAAQPSRLASRYRALFPDRVETEVAEARRLLAHRFALLGHPVDHGARIAWSRDPVSGRDWDRGFSPDIVYRGPARLGDIKLPWELSKHQYCFTLGKAAWLTGDPAFADEILRQIDDWIADNPYRRGIHWISALEVGTRAVSWILAYPFYADRADAAFRARLVRALAQHMVFVEAHASTGRFANNHLIGDAAALVAGGLFLDHRHSRRWLETGLAHLEAEMPRQVTPDGVHAERSIAYHRFVLDQYYLVSALLAPNQRRLSDATLQGMARMTAFLMDVLSPDGRSPGFGDGDDARGLWVHGDAAADFRAALALGAACFDRGDFKAIAGGLAEEVFWLLGDEGVARFEALPAHVPAHASAAYPEGGYYVMRGGWDRADAVMVFDCGPVGYGAAGHGHADALSVQLHAQGYPFLVDPGAFSYNLDYDWRHAFRSTHAHNIVVVDHQDQSIPKDRMAWSQMAAATPRAWHSTPWFDLADGEHDGYRRLADPVTHRRVVAYIKPDVWIVHDRLSASGRHTLDLLMHLRPDCGVAMAPDGVAPDGVAPDGAGVVLEAPDGARLRAWVLDAGGVPRVPEILVGTDEQRAAWFSPGYGTRVPSRALRVRREWSGHSSVTTCLTTSDGVTPTVTVQDGVLRVEVRRPETGQEATLHYRIDPDRPLAVADGRVDGDVLFECEDVRLVVKGPPR